MRKINDRLYICDEGKVFRRISDKAIMGNGIDLGDHDSIENYEEIFESEIETEEE